MPRETAKLTPPEMPEGWNTAADERVDEFVKLEPGENIQGVYQGERAIGEGPTYIIKNREGVMGLNGGRVVLDRAMEKVPVGALIYVYRGDDTEAKASGRPVAQFTVYFKTAGHAAQAKEPSGLPYGEDDIPF